MKRGIEEEGGEVKGGQMRLIIKNLEDMVRIWVESHCQVWSDDGI